MIAKLMKIAYMLDRKGEFALASEVDKIVAELVIRTGLGLAEVASIASELDSCGETNAAGVLDKLLSEKVK